MKYLPLVVPKKKSCQKEKVVPKKNVVPEETDVVKKKLDEKNYVALLKWH